MNRMNEFFIFFLLAFCVNHCSAGWFVVKEDKCEFTANIEFVINFFEKPELFVNKIKTDSLVDCERSCCEHDTCNGYVWDTSDPSENCKLLKCSSNGTDCKEALHPIAPRSMDTNPYKVKLEVGFITGINENGGADEVITSTTTTTTTPKPASINNAANSDWLSQKLGLVSNNQQQNAKKQDKAVTHSSTKTTTNAPITSSSGKTKQVGQTTVGKTSAKATSTKFKSTTALSNVAEDMVPKDSTTLSAVEKHYTHTNTISLTVAFLFGVGFLVAAVAMLARRWFEGFRDANKRGYTRISYLLNGV